MNSNFSIRISGQWRETPNKHACIRRLCSLADKVVVATWSLDDEGLKVTKQRIDTALGRITTTVILDDKSEFNDCIDGKIFPQNHPAHPKCRKNVLRSFYLRYIAKSHVELNSHIIVHLRPDSILMPNFFPNIQDINRLHSCNCKLSKSFQVSDKASFGSSQIMNSYADIWLNIEHYINLLKLENSRATSERLLKIAFPNAIYVSIIKCASFSGNKRKT